MNLLPLVSPTRRTRRRGALSDAGGRCKHGALAGKPFMSPREPRPIGPVPSAPSYSGKGAPHGGVASCPGPRVGNGSPAPGTGPRPVSGEPARAGGTTPGARCTTGNARRRRGNFLDGALPCPARFAVLTGALPSMTPRRERALPRRRCPPDDGTATPGRIRPASTPRSTAGAVECIPPGRPRRPRQQRPVRTAGTAASPARAGTRRVVSGRSSPR